MQLKRIATRNEYDRILQIGTVDTGNGTLFSYRDKRAVATGRLLLIISTGGSGKSAILEAMKTARQKLSKDFGSYVKFIVVDSASDELDPLREMGIDTLNISSGGAIERLSPARRSAAYKKFVPRDYPYHELNDQGSGQKRLHGKVKLYDSDGRGSTNDSVLVKKVKSLFEYEWKDYKAKPVDVMILSGISGGNGSGTFMNIAALVRTACPSDVEITVYGYLMMPDTAEKFAKDDNRRQRLYANGFAALKELESYMSIRLEDRTEILERFGGEGSIVLNAANPVFDYPVLLSGDYDNAVSVIAETIINSAADSGGEFTQRNFYSNISSSRNTKLSVAAVSENGRLNSDVCPEDSHSYCAIGYAYASIPEQIVIPNIVGKVSNKLYEADSDAAVSGIRGGAFVSSLSGFTFTEYEDALRMLLGLGKNAHITENSLWDRIYNLLVARGRAAENNVEVTYDDVAEGRVSQYFRGFHTEEKANEGIHKMIADIRNSLTSMKTQSREVMRKYGPRAIEYLYTGNDPSADPDTLQKFSAICLKRQIQNVLSRFNEEATQPGRYPGMLEPVRRLNIAGQLGKKTRLQEWMQEARKAAEKDIRCRISQRMGGERGDWNNEFSREIDDFVGCCRRLAEIMETLADFYRARGLSVDSENYEDFAKAGSENNGINLCSDARMYDWVQNYIARKVRQVSPDNVREAFIKDFFEHMEDWISDKEGSARTRFDEVMSDVCGIGSHAVESNGIDLTITDYFNETLQDVPPEQQQLKVEAAIDKIMDRLMTKSTPSLKARNMGQTIVSVLVPKSLGSGAIGTMMKNAIKAKLPEGSQYAESSAVDSIVCYQTSVAVALADIEDITKWENAYDSVFDGQTHLSDGEYIDLHMDTGYSQYRELTKAETDRQDGNRRHESAASLTDEENLMCGTGLSWKHYPSVNVGRYYGSLGLDPSSQDTFEGQYWRSFSKKVDLAVRYGIIERERGEGHTYRFYINLLPGEWENIDISGYDEKSGGRYARGRKLFEFLAKQNTNSHAKYRRQIAMSDSPFFGPQGFDLSEAQRLEGWDQSFVDKVMQGYMKRMLRKLTGLYQDMEDTLCRYIEIEKVLCEKETDYIKLYDAEQFVDSFLNGVVNVKDTAWSVLTDSKGGNIPLIVFDRMTVNMRLKSWEKALALDGQRLPVVYLRYKKLIDSGSIDRERLESVKQSRSDSIDPDDYEALFSGRLQALKESLDKYMGIVGNSENPRRLLMEHYRLDSRDEDAADLLVKFFQAAEYAVNGQQ